MLKLNDKHRSIHIHNILHLLATKCVLVSIYMVMAMLDELRGKKRIFFDFKSQKISEKAWKHLFWILESVKSQIPFSLLSKRRRERERCAKKDEEWIKNRQSEREGKEYILFRCKSAAHTLLLLSPFYYVFYAVSLVPLSFLMLFF